VKSRKGCSECKRRRIKVRCLLSKQPVLCSMLTENLVRRSTSKVCANDVEVTRTTLRYASDAAIAASSR
jgi:predicted glycosyl hydrolase (DUF1957 family)